MEQDLASVLKIVAALQGGTLIAILLYGYKILAFFADIKTKTDLMWEDYQNRINGGHYHRRRDDEIAHDSSNGEE